MPLLIDPEPLAVDDRSLVHWLSEGKALLLRTAGGLRLRDAVKAKRLLDQQARRLLHGVVGAVEPVVLAMTEALQSAKLKLGGWWTAMRNALIPGHFAGAMAVLNNPDPAPADVAAIVAQVNRQVGFLDRFRQQLANGQQLLAGAPARATMYAHAVWGSSVNVQRARMRRDGFTSERRVLAVADHCRGCLDQAMAGWSPIGSLLAIGDTECRSRCKCHFEFR